MDAQILTLLIAIGRCVACAECNGVGWKAVPARTVPDWQPAPCDCRVDLRTLLEQQQAYLAQWVTP